MSDTGTPPPGAPEGQPAPPPGAAAKRGFLAQGMRGGAMGCVGCLTFGVIAIVLLFLLLVLANNA